MADTTAIEKKNLEAHVELCAERYRFLEDKLNTLEENLSQLKIMTEEVHQAVILREEKSNNRILQVGVAIISAMAVSIGYLLVNYVF